MNTDYSDILLQIKSLPTASVIALELTNPNRVYILHSNQTKLILGRILCEIEACEFSINDFNIKLEDIKLVLFTSVSDRLSRLVQYRYVIDQYKQKEYKILSEQRSINLTPKMRILDVGRKVLVFVYLVGANRQNKYVVGVFGQIADAKSFIVDYYSGEYPWIVYANNRETKEYFLKERDYVKVKLRS